MSRKFTRLEKYGGGALLVIFILALIASVFKGDGMNSCDRARQELAKAKQIQDQRIEKGSSFGATQGAMAEVSLAQEKVDRECKGK